MGDNYQDPDIPDYPAQAGEIPIHQNHDNVIINIDIPDENSENSYLIRQSKLIKLFVLVDIIFLIIGSFFNIFNLILLLFPLLGWYGASLFNWKLTCGYLIYLFIEIVIEIILGIGVLTIFSIIVTAFISSYVISFIKNIKILDETRQTHLKILTKLPQYKLCGVI